MGMHWAKVESSPRLQRLLAGLLDGRRRSTRELSRECEVYAVGTAIDELRRNGYDIECTREGRIFFYRLIARNGPAGVRAAPAGAGGAEPTSAAAASGAGGSPAVAAPAPQRERTMQARPPGAGSLAVVRRLPAPAGAALKAAMARYCEMKQAEMFDDGPTRRQA